MGKFSYERGTLVLKEPGLERLKRGMLPVERPGVLWGGRREWSACGAEERLASPPVQKAGECAAGRRVSAARCLEPEPIRRRDCQPSLHGFFFGQCRDV